jgi:hypothetical protein
MKKIISIILTLFFAINIFAQNTFEDKIKHIRTEISEDKSLNEENKKSLFLKAEMQVRSNLTFKSTVLQDYHIFETPIVTNPCINANFDNTDTANFATFGWKGFGANSYSKWSSGYVVNNIFSGIVGPSIISPGFKNQTTLSTALPGCSGGNFGGSYHAIVTSGVDANIATLNRSISGNGFRLGNENFYNGAEIISKTFIVPSGMNKFRFKYALVCNPDNGSPGFFNAKAYDASGTIISEVTDIGQSTNPFFILASGFYCRPWHIAELDVSSKIGQQVTVVIMNTDCFGWGHKQYVYLDDFCTTENDTQEGFINLNTIDSCQKFPFTLNGTFGLPNIAGNPATSVSIKLKFYQSGVLVGTKIVPSPIAPNYSINIAQADLPNISGCVDVVAELSFQIKDMSGVPQTVIKTSGSPLSGFKPGQNNDICFDCCNCVQNPKPFLFWTTGSGTAIADNQLDLKCGETYTDKLKCFQTYSLHIQSPCGPNCQPDSVVTTILYPNATTATSYSTTGVPLLANQTGTYVVTIKVKCGGKWCAPCVIKFVQTQKCDPPCDNCKDKVSFEFDSGSSSLDIKTFPAATTVNATFVLGGGTDAYTQIRANIVDFQISSDNPACLQCYNTPNQWGSIISGSIPSFTSAITTYPSVSPFNANNSPREILFDAATPTTIPMGTNLNLAINVPGVNPISCCCIKVVLYVKITYRNNKCEECTKIVRVAFTQCPNGDGAVGNPGSGFEPDGGHPQFKMHAPSKEDAQILNTMPNTKANK